MSLLTTDIYEGAYLMSQGMELERIWMDETSSRRPVVFEFVGDNTDLLRKQYQRGVAQANVVKLKTALNELKDRMFTLIRTKETRYEQPRPAIQV